ncbi:hypothetical protein LZ30DRAFT_318081 [Colletotrichum cereale]|nr:hypothetical protein LZ30DRAFT_318081 [Colletotrichum cereale]
MLELVRRFFLIEKTGCWSGMGTPNHPPPSVDRPLDRHDVRTESFFYSLSTLIYSLILQGAGKRSASIKGGGPMAFHAPILNPEGRCLSLLELCQPPTGCDIREPVKLMLRSPAAHDHRTHVDSWVIIRGSLKGDAHSRTEPGNITIHFRSGHDLVSVHTRAFSLSCLPHFLSQYKLGCHVEERGMWLTCPREDRWTHAPPPNWQQRQGCGEEGQAWPSGPVCGCLGQGGELEAPKSLEDQKPGREETGIFGADVVGSCFSNGQLMLLFPPLAPVQAFV